MNHHQQQQHRQQAAVDQKQNAWFTGAPVSRILLAFQVILYLCVQNNSQPASARNTGLEFDSSSTAPYLYLTSKMTFTTTGELVVGTALAVFLFRKYEREMGSRKFITLCMLVNSIAISLEWIACKLIVYRNRVIDAPESLHWKYAGPYAILGALFYIFHRHAPRLHPRFVSALGFQFSEKSFYYLWFAHLVCSDGWHTVVSTFTGVAAGIVYLNSPLKDVILPNQLVQPIQPIFDRLGLSDGPPPVARAPVRQRAPRAARAPAPHQAQHHQQPPAAAPIPVAAAQQALDQMIPTPDADPAAIEQLTAMGFERPQVVEALRQSHNNLEHAANRLLTGASASS